MEEPKINDDVDIADKIRYKAALNRNLNEVGRAILERRAMVGLENADTYHAMDFIRLSYDALFYDMTAHAMKIFEDHPQSASFWYIKRCKEKEIAAFLKEKNIDFSKIENILPSLKHIRDKTHFHIDRDAVKNSREIWNEAKITGRQLEEVIDCAFMILNHLWILETGQEFPLPEYDGSDATRIAKINNEEQKA